LYRSETLSKNFEARVLSLVKMSCNDRVRKATVIALIIKSSAH